MKDLALAVLWMLRKGFWLRHRFYFWGKWLFAKGFLKEDTLETCENAILKDLLRPDEPCGPARRPASFFWRLQSTADSRSVPASRREAWHIVHYFPISRHSAVCIMVGMLFLQMHGGSTSKMLNLFQKWACSIRHSPLVYVLLPLQAHNWNKQMWCGIINILLYLYPIDFVQSQHRVLWNKCPYDWKYNLPLSASTLLTSIVYARKWIGGGKSGEPNKSPHIQKAAE
jgi:hypothetical protein